MNQAIVILVILLMILLGNGCGKNSQNNEKSSVDTDASVPEYAYVSQTGGETTPPYQSKSSQAFSQPVEGLTAEDFERHMEGDAAFETQFVTGPDLTQPKVDGLGPTFNNDSCGSCHPQDGRGQLPDVPTEQTSVKLGPDASVFLRISIENPTILNQEKSKDNCFGAPEPVPGFSDQLFHRGIVALRPESPGTGQADVWMSFEYFEEKFNDGESITLRKPVFKIVNPYDSPGDEANSRLLQEDVKTSPRVGLPIFGLGLLEAIKEEDILALADENDADGDGYSGRPNYVCDIEKVKAGAGNAISLGRFGWKANTPSVLHQSLGALRGDIGITNFAFLEESIQGTPLYEDYLLTQESVSQEENTPEVSDEFANTLVFYTQTLAVPTRRNIDDSEVIQGAALFAKAECDTCHHPSFTTGEHPSIPTLSHQKIYPFSDMLLHDMGEELADGREDFEANGREWKTRPLWGIGLTQIVNPAATFLHDGRARTLMEAIMWHGGEAEPSREIVRQMSKKERQALIKFLESL